MNLRIFKSGARAFFLNQLQFTSLSTTAINKNNIIYFQFHKRTHHRFLFQSSEPSSAIKSSAKAFLNFVNQSPSPFHAVEESRIRLIEAGYTEIKENQSWNLKKEGKYFFTRNKSSIIAFAVGGKYEPGNGFSIVAAHTDSPCLKVKPVSKRERNGYLQLGVQTYGGGLWHTWFDRDLSIAGRVLVESSSGKFTHHLVKINRPILRIPTIAIHLDRTVDSEGFKFSKENQLFPMLGLVKNALTGSQKDSEINATQFNTKHSPLVLSLIAEELKIKAEEMRDFELCLYDTQPSQIGGIANEFIYSPRLDNLMMSFCSLTTLINSSASIPKDSNIRIVALFDNEEVGSMSAYGADSSFLVDSIKRISNCFETKSGGSFEESMVKSYLISADMAHAVHPNYSEKHEENHRPSMNKGVVIKTNANQRYATTAPTALILRELAKSKSIPLQEFVVRNDSPCGSTIGPILSAKLGLKTIDVGNPQLSMHSIREVGGVNDVDHAINLFQAFYDGYADMNLRIAVD